MHCSIIIFEETASDWQSYHDFNKFRMIEKYPNLLPQRCWGVTVLMCFNKLHTENTEDVLEM